MLDFDFEFPDLYSRAGLARIDAAFVQYLDRGDAALAARLAAARAQPDTLAKKAESELLIALAPHLEDFTAALFGIRAEVQALSGRHAELAPVYAVKRQFVQRRAMHAIRPEDAASLDGAGLEAQLASWFGQPFSELVFSRAVGEWRRDEAQYGNRIETAVRYAACANQSAAGKQKHRTGVLFRPLPEEAARRGRLTIVPPTR